MTLTKKPRKSPAPAAKPKAPRVKPMSAVEFWAGKPGNDYLKRNLVNIEERFPFWEYIIDETNARSFLEGGCNAGWNMMAIREVLRKKNIPDTEYFISGVDLNEDALRLARSQEPPLDVEQMDLRRVATCEEFGGAGSCELSFTSGVLIHVPPDDLKETMCALRDISSHYVLAIEYDSAEERAIPWRGYDDKLWARPYGQLYQEIGLNLVEYGEAEGFKDCKYWLMEK